MGVGRQPSNGLMEYSGKRGGDFNENEGVASSDAFGVRRLTPLSFFFEMRGSAAQGRRACAAARSTQKPRKRRESAAFPDAVPNFFFLRGIVVLRSEKNCLLKIDHQFMRIGSSRRRFDPTV